MSFNLKICIVFNSIMYIHLHIHKPAFKYMHLYIHKKAQ